MGDTYTHGHHESVLRSHTWRTAENSAGYLLDELAAGPALLDVGCGPGTITARPRRARRARRGRRASTRRPTSSSRPRRGRASAGVDNVAFEAGDVYALGFDDASFDVVHAHQVLQHLTDPVAALVEMRRVLRPGGWLAVRDSDYAAFTWAPGDPLLDRWLELYHQVTRRNGAEADAGRYLLGWVQRGRLHRHRRHQLDVDLRRSRADRAWWGGLWADRVAGVVLRRAGGRVRLTDQAELAAIADAWRRWADQPDGWFADPPRRDPRPPLTAQLRGQSSSVTRPFRRSRVSMNSSTISSTTRRVGCTVFMRADDLADEVGDELVGAGALLVGHPVDAPHGVADRAAAGCGMGSGPGPSGRSHSSVHGGAQHARRLAGDRARPHGVAEPGGEELVLHRRRRLGLLGGEPHRAAPHAVGAERHAGGELPAAGDAAGGEHRRAAPTASTTSGTSTMVAICPVWPPASVPWATMRSAPAVGVLAGVLDRPGERGDRDAGRVRPLDEVRRAAGRAPRRPARCRGRSSTSSSGAMLLGSTRMPPMPRPTVGVVGRAAARRSGRAGRRPTPGARRAAARASCAAVEAALVGAGELLGHEQVDAERLALHLLLDPGRGRCRAARGCGRPRRARRSRRRW